jgi:hypothetical protein
MYQVGVDSLMYHDARSTQHQVNEAVFWYVTPSNLMGIYTDFVENSNSCSDKILILAVKWENLCFNL